MKRFIFITVVATLVGLSLSSCGKKCVCHLSGNSAQVLVDLKDNDHEFEMSDYDQNTTCYSIVKVGNVGIELDGQIYQLSYGDYVNYISEYIYYGFFYHSTGEVEYYDAEHYVGDVICEERF